MGKREKQADLEARYAKNLIDGQAYVYRDLPGTLIRRLHQAVVFQLSQAVGGSDLTPVQYAVLAAACGSPDSDQARLSELVRYDRATVGGVIDRLEDKGLVRRSLSRQDKRVRLVNVTAQGKRLLRKLAPDILEVQDTVLDCLEAREREIFIKALARLVDANSMP